MTTAIIKANDTAYEFKNPRLDTVLGTTHKPLMFNGVVLNLTGALSVLFLLELVEAPYTKYSLVAAIDGDPTVGDVIYVRGTGFPITPGRYKQEWQVTQSDATVITLPTTGYNELEILPDLNPNPFEIVIKDTAGTPIANCSCWVATDSAGNNIVSDVIETDTFGNVEFLLNPGTYWLFRQKSGTTFSTNPVEFTIV